MAEILKKIQKRSRGFCSAVVVAAGSSARMGEDKLLLPLGGVPVLARTLCALDRCECINEIVLVARAETAETFAAFRSRYAVHKLTKIVLGGATRTESALAGVSECAKNAALICIHDGARCFVTPEIVEDAVHTAALHFAAAPAVPLHDTVKRAENGVVTETPPREELFAVQTPQVFRADLIKAALTRAVEQGLTYTDDCAAAEALGVPVHLSRGSEENIKLTTPADLALAAAILKRRGEGSV